MSYKISAIPLFEKQVKRLSKRYPSIKNDLRDLGKKLISNPNLGQSLGNNFFKIRMAITSKGKGKSGGARVITHVKIVNEMVYLTTIYDKSDRGNISDKELEEIFKLL